MLICSFAAQDMAPQAGAIFFRCLVRSDNPLWIDGYRRSYITINGQMPGPLVEANEGDTIVGKFPMVFSLLFADATWTEQSMSIMLYPVNQFQL